RCPRAAVGWPRRARISAGGRGVNGTASTCCGWISPRWTRWAIRWVIARVLPVPAPARMHTGPVGAVTAARCSGSSSWSRPPRAAVAESVTAGIMSGPYDVLLSAQDDYSEVSSMITMYSTSWCGFCHRLKSQLNREGIEYQVVDIERDPAAARFVESVNGGNQTVPTLRFDDGSVLTNPSIGQV